ncbi:MAG TPA: hypothetical protein VF409_14540 [Sphingomonas sp.]
MVDSKIALSALAALMILEPPPSAAETVYFPPPYPKRVASCSPSPPSGGAPVVSDFENRWYSEQLSAAAEPSLFEAAGSKASRAGTTIRFTWLRSFDPPVIVRVEGVESRSPRLIAKQLSGAGGYKPGPISKQIDRKLVPAEAEMLRRTLQRTRVFDVPALDCSMGTDGAQWIIEGIDRTGYHFVDRWTPEQGQVRETGLAMLKLTGWTFKNVY